jgi:hypothetical protein
MAGIARRRYAEGKILAEFGEAVMDAILPNEPQHAYMDEMTGGYRGYSWGGHVMSAAPGVWIPLVLPGTAVIFLADSPGNPPLATAIFSTSKDKRRTNPYTPPFRIKSQPFVKCSRPAKCSKMKRSIALIHSSENRKRLGRQSVNNIRSFGFTTRIISRTTDDLSRFGISCNV